MADQHFLAFDSLRAAEDHLGFLSLGRGRDERPEAVRVHVRDHKLRAVTPSLEIHYPDVVVTQTRCGAEEARRRVLHRSYGSKRGQVSVNSIEGAGFERGPEPSADDPDPRQPAVVAWADGDDFCLIVSDKMELEALLRVANDLYR